MSDRKNTPTLIYLSPYKISSWGVEKFGLRNLHRNGVNVRIFDLSMLVQNNHPNSKEYDLDEIEFFNEKISSINEFKIKIEETVNEAIYVDHLSGLNGLGWKNRKIYQILKMYKARYYVVETGSLPQSRCLRRKSYSLIFFYKKIREINKFSKISNLFTRCLLRIGSAYITFFAKKKMRYQLPIKIFSIPNENVDKYLKKYSLNYDSVISVNSYDYDVYRRYIETNSKTKEIKKGECVFVDQCLTNHPELYGDEVSSGRPVSNKTYTKEINNFFSILEKATGLEVVIAAHPRSKYDACSLFGTRRVIKGNTLDLIGGSSLVVTHNSTAISYAVLCNKPVLLIVTEEMIRSSFSMTTDVLGSILGLKVVNISEQCLANYALFEGYENWPKNYNPYIYKYIRARDPVGKNIWEVVYEHLCLDNTRIV